MPMKTIWECQFCGEEWDAKKKEPCPNCGDEEVSELDGSDSERAALDEADEEDDSAF